MAEPYQDQLRLMAGDVPDEVGFVRADRGEGLTFATWSNRADRVARGLIGLGVGPGDRVALLLHGGQATDWVTAYVGIHRAGAVAVPVNTRSVAEEVAGIVGHAGAQVVIAGSDLRDRVPSEPRVVEVPTEPEAGASAETSWTDLLGPAEVDPVDAMVDDDDIADILYTSGTTGRPKGVVVRYGNASVIPVGRPTWSGAGWLSCSPLFTFAGVTAIDNPMKLGMRSLYLPRFEVATWLRVVAEHQPAMVFLVPAMVELLVADPAFAAADLSCIGLCAVGSAPLAPSLQRRLAEHLPEASVSNAYGMTEAGPAYTVLPKEETEARAGSVGRPLPPAEFFAVDEAGRRLAADEVGELVITMPGRRPREYYRDPEATASAWQGDGLHTGDLARIDADGYVYVVGRAKEMIIRGGHNVHTADVEAVLYEHPDVMEAVVAGVPHPVLGEDVAAWIVLHPGVSPEGAAAAIGAFAAERLSDYRVPRRITLVDDLPRNATGKVLKASLPPADEPWAKRHGG